MRGRGVKAAQDGPTVEPAPRDRGFGVGRSPALAVGAWIIGLLLVALGTALLVVDWGLARAGFAFLGFSGVVGLVTLSTGTILAVRRPANPIGWLFLAGGEAQAIPSLVDVVERMVHPARTSLWLRRELG